MKNNFWEKLAAQKGPFFVLAPMADVTDLAQRQMLVKYGKPDVLYTEFVSADGLASEKGREVLIKDLRFNKNEHPIVAQIFGAKPENIKKAAMLVRELGFDGVDINMGCPDKAIIKQGAGSALMKNPTLACEIIRAAKEGAGEMPVSVKTRIGFSKNEIETWLPELLAEKPAAITIHGRTKKEMSEVPAHWDVIARAKEIAKGSGVLIIGNGDVQSLEDGNKKAKQSDVDGVMVGRAIFGNPWFFNSKIKIEDISLEERFAVMIEHTKLFEKDLMGINPMKSAVGGAEQFHGVKGYHVMKKHFKAYVSGFDGAKELRAKLMETENSREVEGIIKEYFLKK
ncbi:MAG: tRNA-dihydrouridine synthase [Candidatus Moranbacteria bacterium GW2011_GWE1_36_7]|nr:MAG: tRNA-dihydrouridine synthase [Candidatus Moranbacteria bacterium GW2011_GWE2_36_40]KKQ13551.1 MAG: tRNA-dihydrouridine synthase [Candidatus Moranbacteria bacterium GW2011_GWE1_36_7]KKQ46715.1 MAG: tRNA-dihydrouridine synthase [Candidatus Moranbacteria bacterium GW2011_GWD2_37_9]